MKIKKSILAVLLCGFVSLSAVGCGQHQKEEPKENTQTEQKKETKEDDSRKVFVNKDLDLTQTQGPFTIKLTHIEVATVKVPDAEKPNFDNKDEVNAIILTAETEHKGDATDSIYLAQGHLTTNTKEQIEANLMASDESVDGDFIGNVVKKGKVIFICDSNPAELTDLKYVVDAGHNQELESVGDNFNFDIKLK